MHATRAIATNPRGGDERSSVADGARGIRRAYLGWECPCRVLPAHDTISSRASDDAMAGGTGSVAEDAPARTSLELEKDNTRVGSGSKRAQTHECNDTAARADVT
jgi:hypothetical protein